MLVGISEKNVLELLWLCQLVVKPLKLATKDNLDFVRDLPTIHC